ncbi:MAG: NAD(+)/NADH kinase [Paramuribaculum sp.]|nr:NAD(+)/NADH kinase [Paramuribaculum sp.]
MRIAVYGNEFQEAHIEAISDLLDRLSSTPGVTLAFEAGFGAYLMRHFTLPPHVILPSPIPAGIDLALSFGGDGTVLRTARDVAPAGIPVMGINTGHMGYLAATHLDDAATLASIIVARRYTIEERAMLEVVAENPCTIRLFALNEVAVLKKDTASMITASTTVDGHFMANYQADGVLVATPTGSTGYNLSTGGPILAPGSHVIVVTPVAPHTLTMRPIVMSDCVKIGIVARSRAESFLLSVDGTSVSLPAGTPVTISRAPFSCRLIRLSDRLFIDTLREKLLWGYDPHAKA